MAVFNSDIAEAEESLILSTSVAHCTRSHARRSCRVASQSQTGLADLQLIIYRYLFSIDV